nr:hypothetical protein [Streptomyces sp. BR123]
MGLGNPLQRGPDDLDLGVVSLGGRPVAARRRRAEAPPSSHARRHRRTLSAHTPTARAISAFETPSSNNSTARTRRASAK